jgi:hypothetical protein
MLLNVQQREALDTALGLTPPYFFGAVLIHDHS